VRKRVRRVSRVRELPQEESLGGVEDERVVTD
jgi:hypothetical protein